MSTFRLMPLMTIVLLAGCAGEREAVHPVDVLWRGVGPAELPRAPSAQANAPAVSAGETPVISYDLTLLTATLQDFVSGGLIDPLHPQPQVVADGRLRAFIASHAMETAECVMTGSSGGTGQTAFTTDYAFIADYHFDQHDVPLPVISTLTFGKLLSITGHVDHRGVVLDQFQRRSSELVGVATEVGSYPFQGLLRQYPWEEPLLICSEASLQGVALPLGAGNAVVVPCQYWSDRPSPSVHSRMPLVTVADTGTASSPGFPQRQQQVVCIRAHVLAGIVAQGTTQKRGPVLASPDLTPPWHAAKSL